MASGKGKGACGWIGAAGAASELLRSFMAVPIKRKLPKVFVTGAARTCCRGEDGAARTGMPAAAREWCSDGASPIARAKAARTGRRCTQHAHDAPGTSCMPTACRVDGLFHVAPSRFPRCEPVSQSRDAHVRGLASRMFIGGGASGPVKVSSALQKTGRSSKYSPCGKLRSCDCAPSM